MAYTATLKISKILMTNPNSENEEDCPSAIKICRHPACCADNAAAGEHQQKYCQKRICSQRTTCPDLYRPSLALRKPGGLMRYTTLIAIIIVTIINNQNGKSVCV